MKSRIVDSKAGGTLAAASQTSRTDLTRLLTAWGNGDATAANQLMPLVYDELHRAAVRAMRGEAVGHTLQPTALVNEVYLRFADESRAKWQNRTQFFGVAAQVMRRVLVDHARARIAGKRGRGERPITLDEVRDASQPVEESNGVDVLELHEALEKLATLDPKQARVVELRYFSGLTIEETAEALGISPATVKREWAFARAWLQRELRPA